MAHRLTYTQRWREDDKTLNELGLIERDTLLAEFERVVSDKSYPLHVDLLYAILTYSWLNSHFPEQ